MFNFSKPKWLRTDKEKNFDNQMMNQHNAELERKLNQLQDAISSLKPVYSNMNFFDMFNLISMKYNDCQREPIGDNDKRKTSEIINILNKYRVKTFHADNRDKDTLFLTFRTMVTRAGWHSTVEIVMFDSIDKDIFDVEYKPNPKNDNTDKSIPCVSVNFYTITVNQLDEKRNNLVIELVKNKGLSNCCILTDTGTTNRQFMLKDKHCNSPSMYAPDESGLHMMFFHLKNFDEILKEIGEVDDLFEVDDSLKKNVMDKTVARRNAFETEIKETRNEYQNQKLQLIYSAIFAHIDAPDAVKRLFDGRGLTKGGKLRSAKKTSKARYYRRSVGGIKHRKKTTRRRRR